MTKMHQNTFGGRAVELRELMHSPDPLAAMGAISRGKGEKGRGEERRERTYFYGGRKGGNLGQRGERGRKGRGRESP